MVKERSFKVKKKNDKPKSTTKELVKKSAGRKSPKSKSTTKTNARIPSQEATIHELIPSKDMKTPISNIVISAVRANLPTRKPNGKLHFPDFPKFQPNLTPKEVLQMGSFGGTYFRPIKSSITNQSYSGLYKELPKDWLEGLDLNLYVCSSTYRDHVNKYNVSCGGDLEMWETSGWIKDVDPYGWFQWYCRFYQGRRCSDDERQIGRGLGVVGPKGRWRNNLIKKCCSVGKFLEDVVDDPSISPKVRQLLQHWAYKLTLDDLIAGQKSMKNKL